MEIVRKTIPHPDQNLSFVYAEFAKTCQTLIEKAECGTPHIRLKSVKLDENRNTYYLPSYYGILLAVYVPPQVKFRIELNSIIFYDDSDSNFHLNYVSKLTKDEKRRYVRRVPFSPGLPPFLVDGAVRFYFSHQCTVFFELVFVDTYPGLSGDRILVLCSECFEEDPWDKETGRSYSKKVAKLVCLKNGYMGFLDVFNKSGRYTLPLDPPVSDIRNKEDLASMVT